MSPVCFEDAVASFAHGFAFTRSRTHPYLVERLGSFAWRLHDAPRRSGDPRREEIIAHDLPPEEVAALAARHAAGRYTLCCLLRTGEPDDALRGGFRELGFRLMVTEDLFVHSLEPLPPRGGVLPVERVRSPELAARLAKAARRSQIRPADLQAEPPPQRQYVALDGEEPVGWVGSVVTGDTCWCTNMYVRPEYRRRGLARALLAEMLADDRAGGARGNVLLSSHTGSKLYPTVGYDLLGRLYAFVPGK